MFYLISIGWPFRCHWVVNLCVCRHWYRFIISNDQTIDLATDVERNVINICKIFDQWISWLVHSKVRNELFTCLETDIICHSDFQWLKPSAKTSRVSQASHSRSLDCSPPFIQVETAWLWKSGLNEIIMATTSEACVLGSKCVTKSSQRVELIPIITH